MSLVLVLALASPAPAATLFEEEFATDASTSAFAVTYPDWSVQGTNGVPVSASASGGDLVLSPGGSPAGCDPVFVQATTAVPAAPAGPYWVDASVRAVSGDIDPMCRN